MGQGSIQILDAFGDGTRIRLIAVSPFAKKALSTAPIPPSVHPQIHRGLDPLSARSRDHLLNPIADPSDPYVAANRPAIGDSAIANLGIVPSGTAYPMLEAVSRDVAIRGDFGLDTNLDGGFP